MTDTITLKPDTVLIGLNPTTAQFDIQTRRRRFEARAAEAAGDAKGRHEDCDRDWALYEQH